VGSRVRGLFTRTLGKGGGKRKEKIGRGEDGREERRGEERKRLQ
jgi:hypothetical protein